MKKLISGVSEFLSGKFSQMAVSLTDRLCKNSNKLSRYWIENNFSNNYFPKLILAVKAGYTWQGEQKWIFDLKRGYRVEISPKWAEIPVKIMESCFAILPTSRPHFSELHAVFSAMLQSKSG